jgi:hypothetical protein
MRQVPRAVASAVPGPGRLAGQVRAELAMAWRDAIDRVREDLRADPWLPYLLLAAALLSLFWIWHRLPNFATRDERWRVVDPIEAFAALEREVSVASLQEGVTTWRSYGGTFYPVAVVLVPVLLVALAVGELAGFVAMGRHSVGELWAHWLGTPGWLWTASVLAARLLSVAFTVGSVYLVYRLGVKTYDQATGRLAASLFTVTWGMLVLAHEAGEDMPSLFLFLLSVSQALSYVETGSRRTFYRACLAGGLAAGFKLSGGVAAVVIGMLFLTRAFRAEGPLTRQVWQPRLLASGVGLGTVAILVVYPSVLVGDPAELGGRILRALSAKGSPHGWRVKPNWWWILRGYLHGLGLPMTVGAVVAVLAAVPTLNERSRTADGLRVALVIVAVFLAGVAQWSYVRTHHLLPTFPLLVLVVAVAGQRLRERRPSVGRVVLAVLLVTSGIYAVGGDLAYASQPRDQSAAWLATHADPDDAVETYVRDPQEAGVPHDATILHPGNGTVRVDNVTYHPGRTRWTRAMPERCPEYIVLNYHQSLLFLAPDSWSKRADVVSNPALERYYRDLLAEDTYPYEVAGEFGRRPRFLDGQGRRPAWQAMLRVGIRPRTMQYGDPQDFGVDQYTVVLERTGECDPEATSPLR